MSFVFNTGGDVNQMPSASRRTVEVLKFGNGCIRIAQSNEK